MRLLAVSERAKQLFGEDREITWPTGINPEPGQASHPWLFPELAEAPSPKIPGRQKGRMTPSLFSEAAAATTATTLDRVHAAMLLQAGGQANALRTLIKAEQDRSPEFPAPGQRPLGPLPCQQRGKAFTGRHAVGGTEVEKRVSVQ